MRTRIAVAMLLLLWPVLAHAQEQAERYELVRVDFKAGGFTVGELLSMSSTQVRIMDLQRLEEVVFERHELSGVEKSLPEKQVIAIAGLPPYVAWRVGRLLRDPMSGKVAEVEEGAIFLTRSDGARPERGQKLVVWREGAELVDPGSGESLGRARTRVGELEVVEVQDKLVRARRADRGEEPVEVGDVVSSTDASRLVAVAPLTDDQGVVTEPGRRLGDALATRLIQAGGMVVNPAEVSKAVKDLSPPPKSADEGPVEVVDARKLGKTVGAAYVLCGTIGPSAQVPAAFNDVHVRLLSVETGTPVLAVTHRVPAGRTPGTPGPAAPTVAFKVSAQRGWQPVLRLAKGEQWRITAIGKWRIAPTRSSDATGTGQLGKTTPLRSAHAGALIGRMGKNIFLVGRAYTVDAGEGGVLELRINDADKFRHDNSGELLVTLVRVKP